MRRIMLGVLGLLLLGLAGGVIFLGFYDLKVPTQTLEVVVPNERLIPQ